MGQMVGPEGRFFTLQAQEAGVHQEMPSGCLQEWEVLTLIYKLPYPSPCWLPQTPLLWGTLSIKHLYRQMFTLQFKHTKQNKG